MAREKAPVKSCCADEDLRLEPQDPHEQQGMVPHVCSAALGREEVLSGQTVSSRFSEGDHASEIQ